MFDVNLFSKTTNFFASSFVQAAAEAKTAALPNKTCSPFLHVFFFGLIGFACGLHDTSIEMATKVKIDVVFRVPTENVPQFHCQTKKNAGRNISISMLMSSKKELIGTYINHLHAFN